MIPRPTPRRSPAGVLTAVALAVLLIVAAVPAGASTTTTIEIEDFAVITDNYNMPTYDLGAYFTGVCFNSPEQITTPFTLIWFGSFTVSNPNTYSNGSYVNLGGKGDGYLFFQRFPSGGGQSFVSLTVNNLSASGTNELLSFSGLNPGFESIYATNAVTRDHPNPSSGRGEFYNYHPAVLYDAIGGSYTINRPSPFKNVITINSDDEITPTSTDAFVITKIFDGKGYKSQIIVLGKNDVKYLDATDTVNSSLTIAANQRPYTIAVKSTSLNRWYNSTVFGNDPPIGANATATATIYVRDSQTGALIPGARAIVLDSQTGTTLINNTLASGTGTFDLEKSHTLRYLASATADDYALLSPIQFDTGDSGVSIVLWMAPDAPPDVPTEPEKSMLYGYIQTQGSQQPISGATVSLDGYGSTTTSSTGFYLFNNVTPGTYDISTSAPLHDALSERVTVDAAPTQHNLALKGHFLLTVTIKDGDTLANLQNATISLSDGQESTQNPATFTADYGPYTITAAAGGYYPQTQSAYLDKPGTTTATVLLTARPEPVPPPEMPNYPPHNVKFTVQTIFGTPIPGVNVTAQGIQQTPSQNVLERLLGLNMTSTPITTELMSGTTDTNGEINFMMVEAVKYRISLYKPDVVNQTLEIYPKEDTYPIIISTAGGPLLPDAGDPLRDIHINITTSTEGDTGRILVDYNDTTLKTTGLSIQVTQQNTTDSSAPEEVIASHTVANDANVTHIFDLPDYKGQSFFVRLEAEHPDFGTINRDYAVAFKGVRVPLGPLPDGLYIYVAGFGLMLLGGIFGATSATRGVVVIALAGWLFWGFGWLDDLGLIAPVSLGLVSTLAVMGVIVTRYREEGYQ